MADYNGKLIVIDGGDGSGKTTQIQLLVNYCKENNVPHAYYDFPNYDSFFGKLIASFLRGELGSLDEVSPYLASLPFALDRKDQKENIINDLKHGKLVLMNRYISSNLAHQGSKFENDDEKNTFFTWIEELEYTIHNMPREDLIIYLYVPWKIGQELTTMREDRSYLKGKKDIQEHNSEYREKTEHTYLKLAEQNSNWTKLDCTTDGTIKSREVIHQEIIHLLQNNALIAKS